MNKPLMTTIQLPKATKLQTNKRDDNHSVTQGNQLTNYKETKGMTTGRHNHKMQYSKENPCVKKFITQQLSKNNQDMYLHNS